MPWSSMRFNLASARNVGLFFFPLLFYYQPKGKCITVSLAAFSMSHEEVRKERPSL